MCTHEYAKCQQIILKSIKRKKNRFYFCKFPNCSSIENFNSQYTQKECTKLCAEKLFSKYHIFFVIFNPISDRIFCSFSFFPGLLFLSKIPNYNSSTYYILLVFFCRLTFTLISFEFLFEEVKKRHENFYTEHEANERLRVYCASSVGSLNRCSFDSSISTGLFLFYVFQQHNTALLCVVVLLSFIPFHIFSNASHLAFCVYEMKRHLHTQIQCYFVVFSLSLRFLRSVISLEHKEICVKQSILSQVFVSVFSLIQMQNTCRNLCERSGNNDKITVQIYFEFWNQ